jgi:DNA-directed RNA polymerase specialized sigma24 family protein
MMSAGAAERESPSESVPPWAWLPPDRQDVAGMSVAALARACQQETSRFLAGQPSCPWYGYELFRRAVCLGDDAAWHALVRQYRGTVRVWAKRSSALAAAGGEADDWVDLAFARFWGAVRPERFPQFPDLASLLRYLQLCLHSLLADAARARATAARPLDAGGAAGPELPDVGSAVVAALAARELWEIVMGEVEDETERLLVRLSFVENLKPRQVQARYPDRFPCVGDVYRIKRNLLDRLRRCPRLARFAA